jgi:cell division protein FtsB
MSGRAGTAHGGYRLRPAPRTARRGGRRTRIHWDRLGRVALLIVLAAVLLSYINPVVNFVDAWKDNRTEKAQLRELAAENERLRERIGVVDGPAAAEHAARRIGMVAEGEGAYVIKGLGGR